MVGQRGKPGISSVISNFAIVARFVWVRLLLGQLLKCVGDHDDTRGRAPTGLHSDWWFY